MLELFWLGDTTQALEFHYRTHSKDGEGTAFTGVCRFTGGGGELLQFCWGDPNLSGEGTPILVGATPTLPGVPHFYQGVPQFCWGGGAVGYPNSAEETQILPGGYPNSAGGHLDSTRGYPNSARGRAPQFYSGDILILPGSHTPILLGVPQFCQRGTPILLGAVGGGHQFCWGYPTSTGALILPGGIPTSAR